MRLIKRILIAVLLLMLLGLGLLFSVQNDTRVAVDLLLIQLPEQRLALWILLAFACGGLLGMGLSALTLFRLKSGNLLLRRRLERREQELDKLRTSDLRPKLAKAKEGGRA